jgi:hypothetical protein
MHPHLQDLAWCAIRKSTSEQEVLVFAVEICEAWSEFATMLANQALTATTKVEEPIGNDNFICGLNESGLDDYAIKLAPDLKERLARPVIDGHARTLVFYAEGILTLDIEATSRLPAC